MSDSIDIHFLNVGWGDCSLVYFPERVRKSDGHEKKERIMVVDLNLYEDHEEYTNFIEYYKQNFVDSLGNYKPIFRFVCTHPHHDHICGLKKLFDEAEISIYNFWDLDHEYEPEDFSGHPWHKDDWDAYTEKVKNGVKIRVIQTNRDDTPRQFWDDDEDRITILSPSLEMIKKAHYNEDGSKKDKKDVDIDHMSYALMLKINGLKVILAGDGKADAWDDIFANCADLIKDCDILKAGHHGHKSAFHEEAVKLMNPKYIIFSNSKEEDNINGASDEYSKAVPQAKILKTYESGNLIAKCFFDEHIEINDTFGNDLG